MEYYYMNIHMHMLKQFINDSCYNNYLYILGAKNDFLDDKCLDNV